MCIQCSRCLAVFACRNNPWIRPSGKGWDNFGEEAMNCPANFNFVANCARCYK